MKSTTVLSVAINLPINGMTVKTGLVLEMMCKFEDLLCRYPFTLERLNETEEEYKLCIICALFKIKREISVLRVTK